MDLSNYHSHCSFCDGHAPMEEFVCAAIEQGFCSYGFSSHSPLPFETNWSMSRNNVEDYFAEFTRLKEIYGDEIELYVGMEIDYLDGNYNPSIAYFQQLPLDYRIGSVHYVQNPDTGEMMDMDGPVELFRENLKSVFGGDLKRLIECYFKVSCRMVELGGFDFVAHADKIAMNSSLCNPDIVKTSWYRKYVMEYLTLIAEKHIMLEINTKTYHRRNLLYPDVSYFKTLKELKIPVMVNSDAHYPRYINDGREEAFRILLSAGIRTTMRLSQGKWEEIEVMV